MRPFLPAVLGLLLAAGVPPPAAALVPSHALHLASDDCRTYLPPVVGSLPYPPHVVTCGVEAEVQVDLVGCAAGTCSVSVEALSAHGRSPFLGEWVLVVGAQQTSGPSAFGPAVHACHTSALTDQPSSCQGSATLVVDGLAADACQTFRVWSVYVSQTYWARARAASVFTLCVDGTGTPSAFVHA